MKKIEEIKIELRNTALGIRPIETLEEIAKVNLEQRDIGIILTWAKKENILETLQNRYAEYETAEEERVAKNVLESRSDFKKFFPLWNDFVEIIREESGVIGNINKLTIVGSGPFPITAIAFAGLVQYPIECIERLKNFCNLSDKVTKKMKLAGQVKIRCFDGQNFDFESSDAVIITLLTDDKIAVIERIKETNPSAKIIVRTVSGLLELLYKKPIEVEQKYQHKTLPYSIILK